MGSAQLVHNPLDLAKAEGAPLPVLAIQRHIGPIDQGLHRPMLLQPCLDHITKGLFVGEGRGRGVLNIGLGYTAMPGPPHKGLVRFEGG